MSQPPDLTADAVGAALTTKRFGRSLDLREVTESTNDDARAAADQGCPDGHVVVADHQRAGRGASGRSWDSPPGCDLYLSVVARLPIVAETLPPLTLAVGLGVASALDVSLPDGVETKIKWPNDVLIDDRKCAGILIETASMGGEVAHAILGIGVNINREAFAPPLDETATSLRLASGVEQSRTELLARLLHRVEQHVDRFFRDGPIPIAALVDRRLAWRGERVRVDDDECTLLGVAPTGALRVRMQGVERDLYNGRIERA